MDKKISRRKFILASAGSSALVFGSALLSGCATPSDKNSDVDQAAKDKPTSSEKSEKTAELGGDYDVVVIGAGGAGMSAALTLNEGGAKVAILEKMGMTGGNTRFAEGGMNASETKVQKEQGIEDSNELFAQDTFKGGHELGNMELINYMCQNSNAAIERLSSRGMNLTKLSTSGGASVPRIHRPEDGSAVGSYFVKHMTQLCKDRGIDVLTDMDVKSIEQDSNKNISGVKAIYKKKDEALFNCKALIIATGGFGANHKMLAQYRPELLEAVTTNMAGAQGDGIVMAEALGANTVDMDQIQVHPTVEQSTSLLLSEGIRGDGAILINTEGNRFIDELLTRDKVSEAEWNQPGKGSYAIFDKRVYDENTSIEEKFVKGKLITIAESLEDLAKQLDLPQDAFMKTIKDYHKAIDADTVDGKLTEQKGKTSDPFGRWKSRYKLENAPFYAVKVAPGIHHTMGGLKINVNAEVLNNDNEKISGLFAAGEVTGGIHGGNRLGGNAMCDINVFGHRAAESALEYIK